MSLPFRVYPTVQAGLKEPHRGSANREQTTRQPGNLSRSDNSFLGHPGRVLRPTFERFQFGGLLLAGVLLWSASASGQLPQRPVLHHEAVMEMAGSAETLARENDWSVVIAIVDEGGHLLHLRRLEGAIVPSVEIAVAKARTAALYRIPSRSFQDAFDQGSLRLLTVPEVLGIGGGLPVEVEGVTVGGIGVSGATIPQDEVVARAGLDALAAMLERTEIEQPGEGSDL